MATACGRSRWQLVTTGAEPVAARPHLEPIVLLGESAAARRVNDEVRAAAAARCVLVEGEPGLDLDQVATTVHERSGRGGPCIRLVAGAGENPDAIDSSLAHARGGTLVISELQSFSAAGQRRLLQVARTAEVSAESSLIAAVSVSPDRDKPSLRRDLVRHFQQARVSVPPLRGRAEDIPIMAGALVRAACVEAGLPPKAFCEAAVAVMAAMPWHGNLEELRQVIDHLVRSGADREIGLRDVLAQVRMEATIRPGVPVRTLRAARCQFERDYIREVLRREGGRVGDAARALGIQRTNLYRKARQLGISVTRPEHL